jgi:hypothetical protein
MSFYAFVFLLFVGLFIDSAYSECPTNWTALNRDCCSSTFGFNSTAPTFNVAQGVDYPLNFIVWNDPSSWSLGIDTDWGTLNILWGHQTGNRSKPYGTYEHIDVVRIFHQSGKGLYGLQFHISSGQCYWKKTQQCRLTQFHFWFCNKTI